MEMLQLKRSVAVELSVEDKFSDFLFLLCRSRIMVLIYNLSTFDKLQVRWKHPYSGDGTSASSFFGEEEDGESGQILK
ncbi:predicted protein [Arabidopsis lyrata subsp. lyrata]|uniref:Predicted protein n=1 Tax=Arabidopsis lyrata subsp. lyrata TaxID=81972 RepID=D7LIY5_ARALL|nr:predicted protein [Arabidopsis lyrata subsp. lyrata]